MLPNTFALNAKDDAEESHEVVLWNLMAPLSRTATDNCSDAGFYLPWIVDMNYICL